MSEHPQKVAVGKGGMVSTAHAGATRAGTRMLREGGNAFDAAVAAAFALGVCEPQASGLGGQTFMLVHLAAERRTFALDGSSRAPHRTPPREMSRKERLRGHRASTVPSTPAALGYTLERYGRLDLATVLAPAIELAEEGYPVTALQHRLQERELEHLRSHSGGDLFLAGGAPWTVGETFGQPALARTLRRLAGHGISDFYTGGIAAAIAEDMAAHDGLIQQDDLAQVPWPIERRPVSSRFRGRRIFTFPPPGAGRTLLEITNVLDQFPENQLDPDTPRGAVLLAETVRRANIDRQDRPFDPNFYAQIEDRRKLTPEYSRLVARQVRAKVRRPAGETTHLSVVDGEGNAVALTQSIERVYGSFAACPGLGFLYNNYLSAFEHDDISHPYYLRPNAVPWASVAPTFVMGRGGVHLVLGSPGSERIASTIAQVLLRLNRQGLADAVESPRLHSSVNGEVTMEASRFRDDIPAYLERRAFRVRAVEPFSFYLGCIAAVQRLKDRWIGVADVRRDGAAEGIGR